MTSATFVDADVDGHLDLFIGWWYYGPNHGVISAGERYYTSYLSHGYVSSGQAIIIGNAVYHVVVQSGVPRLQRIATLGEPSRIFWYMQPER